MPTTSSQSGAFIALLLAMTIVSACGGSGRPANPPPPVDPPPTVEPPVACDPVAGDSPATRTGRTIPYLPSARDALRRQGIVRMINRSAEDGTASISAFDDEGNPYGPLTVSICANQSVELDSSDIENGNADKGFPQGTGAGQGAWRLEISSALDLAVFSRVVTQDGFAAPMQSTAPWDNDGYRIATFNPGRDPVQESLLRVINLGEATVTVTIAGRDDAGQSGTGTVTVQVPGGAAGTWSATELEPGVAPVIAGSLGAGSGRWRLAIDPDQPILAMSLLSNPAGYLANLSAAPVYPTDGVHRVPFLPSAADALERQGLVRVINRSNMSGEVSISAFDDSGLDYEPLTLSLDANEAKHFDSGDLEGGNPQIGLSGSTGAGFGDWRLEVTSSLRLEVLAYLRTVDGFLAPMYETVPRDGGAYRLSSFWSGDPAGRSSRLRLVNAGQESARVTIAGTDERSERSAGVAAVNLAAGASRTLEAQALETGGDGIEGALGNGEGAWQLLVESEQPITVLNLLSSPTGHLANLSAATAESQTIKLDFDAGTQGFVADFADYPPADSDIYQLTSGRRSLPPPLASESGLYISGVNRSDDLFMFFKGRVGGLVPGGRYSVTAGVEVATSVPAGCVGVGGAPGESVWIKVGASDIEPLPFLENGWLRMNVDIGGQSRGGENAQVSGNVANTRSCEEPRRWERKFFPAVSIPAPVTASPDGRAWLLFGVDSGFESLTEIYFLRVWARFARQ